MNLHGNLARVGQTRKGHLDGHFRDELSGKRMGVRLQEASVMQGLRGGPENYLNYLGGWVVVVVVMVGSGAPLLEE